MKKACIFDLDGTLLYTLDSMMRPGNMVLRALGLTPLPKDDYRRFCGEGAAMLTRRFLIAGGDKEASHFEEGYALYMKYFSEDPLYGVVPYPQIPELLQSLRERGVRLAVCSNKPAAATHDIIVTLFPGLFESIVGQSDALRRKPAPDMPMAVCEQLNLAPEDCLYCGDSGTDMQTGKGAGMKSVGVLWGYRDDKELLENGCDGLAQTPMDILNYL